MSIPESEVFRCFSAELVTAISATDPLGLALKLFSRKFVERDTVEDVCLPTNSPTAKSCMIVTAINRKVEADPSLFHQFITLLQDEGDSLKTISKRLMEKYRSIQQKVLGPSILHPHNAPHQSALCLYADKLRTLYAQSELPRYSNPACYKWTPSPSKKYIDLTTINRKVMTTKQVDEYKQAALYGQISEKGSANTVQLEEILQAEPGKQLECVLVEGPPGIGKSTLAWHLCNCWGKRELFQQYSTVLLLPLRDQRVQGAKCVEDLFICADTKLQERVHKEVTQENYDGKDTLIVLEGLDELPNHLLSQPSIFTALLSGEVLSHATILITSRPCATEQIKKYWEKRISRHLEITGFTKENIEKYTESVLLNCEQLSGFSKYISALPHIQSLLYVPLHCVIAITVYLQHQHSRKPPPRTLTGLYACLTQTILAQYLNDHPHYTSGDYITDKVFDLTIPHQVYIHFKELCRIAFELVIHKQLIIADMPKELHELGFTDAVPELLLYQQSANYSYNFLHLSVQEFLAAYHVSLMNSSEQEEFLEMKFTDNIFEFVNMLRFVVGVTNLKGLNRVMVQKKLQIHQNHATKSGEIKDISLDLLYECQDVSFLETGYTFKFRSRRSFLSSKLHICLALGYCIANSSCGWRLFLGFCSDSTQAEMILQGLKEGKTCNTNYRIKSIDVCCSEFTDKLFTQHTPKIFFQFIESLSFSNSKPLPPCLLKMIPTMDKLNSVTLANAHISQVDALATSLEELLPAMSRVPNLKSVQLLRLKSGSVAVFCQWLPTCRLEALKLGPLSSDDIEMVSNALSTVSTLKALNMFTAEFTFQSVQTFVSMLQQNHSLTEVKITFSLDNHSACYLFEALHHNKSLIKLDLSYNTVGEKGALAAANVLSQNTTLEELSFENSKVSGKGAVAIAEALYHNTALRKLDLSYNTIGERGELAMAEMLKCNTSLEELNFCRAEISHNGITAMAGALHHNNTLRKLDMSNSPRPIVDRDAIAMAEMLKHNTTLKELKLDLTRISCDSTIAIAEALHHNKSLRKLNLCGHKADERGAIAMATMLKHNTTLEELNFVEKIGLTRIGDKGVEALLESLAVNQHLKKLVLFIDYSETAESLSVYHEHKERVHFGL